MISFSDYNATTVEEKWTIIRALRDAELLRSDFTQFLDAPLTLQEIETWANYRQELRDIPQTFSDPDLVVFPISPGV